jgi:tetratricopeptide (TPR) repeat protein
MTKKEKAISALMAVFPAAETFTMFSQNSDNAIILDSFINFAARNGIIKTADSKNLELFISNHLTPAGDAPPQHLNFEDLLDKKDELLHLSLSLRALTDRINALIAGEKLGLPKVTNSMFTRLRKEPADTGYKKNVLRSFAFWLGHERADLAPTWNYETLLKLCGKSKRMENYKEGVRIGFSLSGRGDVIDHEIVNWLKKTLKNYVEQSISHFLYGQWGKVRSHDITTTYIDFPKEKEASDPAAYRQCLRSAVSLAHQIAVKWALSKYCTKNRFLSIGIVAGEFTGIDNYLLPLLNARLPDDPVIRVSDYARQCLLINDIRVILCQKPTETTLFNGEALTIWWIISLWSMLYFDFVSDLLDDNILQNDPDSMEKLNRLLWPADVREPYPPGADEPNAVKTFFRFPHNSLLGVEIAKTLYYRRRFVEAVEIMRVVLSINPTDLTARTLRMVLFRNMAVAAPSYPIALGLFKMAEHEALYIRENCISQSEDYFCEHAVVHLAKAMLTVRYLRENGTSIGELKEINKLKQSAFAAFDEAENLFEKAMTVSPSGIRSSYLMDTVRILKTILKSDEDIFVNPQKPLDAKPEIVKRPSEEVLWQLGFRREDMPAQFQFDFSKELMIKSYKIHEASISLQAYHPTTHFCHAVALWDFLPIRTVATAQRVLQLIKEAIIIAKEVEKKGVCIYSFSRTYGEMMPAREFISHMEKSIQMIGKETSENLYELNADEIIYPKGKLSSILLTLNF